MKRNRNSGDLKQETGKSSEAAFRLEISQCICEQCLFPDTKWHAKQLELCSEEPTTLQPQVFHCNYEDEEQFRATIYQKIVTPFLLNLVGLRDFRFLFVVHL